MGKALSTIGRRANQRFNIEHRAQKAIEKQTHIPKVAPRHPSTVDHFKTAEQSSEIKEELDRKDESLLDKLKNVRIESYGPAPEIRAKSVGRSLPQNRKRVDETDLGFEQPAVVSPGKLTMQTLMDVLGKNMVEPKTYTAREIAAEHSLDKQKVENMLEYFKAFSLYVPKTGEVVAGNLKGGGNVGANLLDYKKTLLEDEKK